jgi:hypothetical protein
VASEINSLEQFKADSSRENEAAQSCAASILLLFGDLSSIKLAIVSIESHSVRVSPHIH